MNIEMKERVKWLKEAVVIADSVKLNGYHLIGSNVKAIVKALEIYEKLLSLPTRTIETLEVGDYVEYDNESEKEVFIVKNIDYRRETFFIEGDGGTYLFPKNDDISDVSIIPHEAMELLKEVIGNE